MHILYVGVILGVIIYISWFGYYVLYLPRKIKRWFEASMSRLFILDIALTGVSMTGISNLSDSLTAVIASSVVGFLATLTVCGIRCYQKIRSMIGMLEPK